MLRDKQRIVLVEDHPDDAFLAWQQLTDAHQGTVQVDVVPTLAQTLALLALGPVDAIVLNLNLPDSQGLLTLRRVRAAAAQVPIIVVTRLVNERLRAQLLAEGAEDVYDKHDANSHLFSRSVLYVVERNRARAQHARLQVLLETLPDAVVIADDAGSVLFANPAALQLMGHRGAHLIGEHVRATLQQAGTDSQTLALPLLAGAAPQPCELRTVPITWDGQPARLVSVTAPARAQPVGPAPTGLADDARTQHAIRLKGELLTRMRLQISSQMLAVSGLHAGLGDAEMEPLQSCYLPTLQRGAPALLSALAAA